MGFSEIESGVFALLESDFSLLNKAVLHLDDALDPVRIKFMTPEEAEKHKILMQRKADLAAKRKAEREKAEEIRRRVDADQREKA